MVPRAAAVGVLLGGGAVECANAAQDANACVCCAPRSPRPGTWIRWRM